jgi:hypothetical protein
VTVRFRRFCRQNNGSCDISATQFVRQANATDFKTHLTNDSAASRA